MDYTQEQVDAEKEFFDRNWTGDQTIARPLLRRYLRRDTRSVLVDLLRLNLEVQQYWLVSEAKIALHASQLMRKYSRNPSVTIAKQHYPRILKGVYLRMKQLKFAKTKDLAEAMLSKLNNEKTERQPWGTVFLKYLKLLLGDVKTESIQERAFYVWLALKDMNRPMPPTDYTANGRKVRHNIDKWHVFDGLALKLKSPMYNGENDGIIAKMLQGFSSKSNFELTKENPIGNFSSYSYDYYTNPICEVESERELIALLAMIAARRITESYAGYKKNPRDISFETWFYQELAQLQKNTINVNRFYISREP